MTSLFDDMADAVPLPDVISKAAFAAEIGVSKPRVSQLLKQGLPTTQNGKIPRAQALEWYKDKIDPNRRRAFTDAPKGGARAQLDALKIERERLALAKDRGEVIDRAAARKAVFERARAERDAWRSWATRLAPQLAAELKADAAATHATLDREVRRHLAELAETAFEDLTGA